MFKIITSGIVAVSALVLVPAPAQANGAWSTIVDVKWTGTVTRSASGALQLRGADGSTLPTAALPGGLYKPGTQATLTFQAAMPNQAYFGSNSPYRPALSTDGIYRIALAGGTGAKPAGLGGASAPVLTIGGKLATGLLAKDLTLSMTYNANTNRYGFDPKGSFGNGFSGKGFVIDPKKFQLVPCAGKSCTPGYDPRPAPKPGKGNLWDWFKGGVKGGGKGPGKGNGGGGGGGSTPVPEPGMLGMFGAAALILPLRRRLARRAAR